GFIAFLVDAFLVIAGESLEKWEHYSEMSLSAGCAAFFISFGYFMYLVLTADYSYTYVSDYVNNDMDFLMRVSAIWSGQAGSFFFWGFLATLAYLSFRLMFRDYAHEPVFWRSFVLLTLQVAVLAALTILNDPFQINVFPTTDGVGLNPLLMNMWNVIHPPIIFIGYTLCLIPMVIAITRISILENGRVPNFEGKERLDRFFEFMVSLAWFVLSSGIIVGAYWAYITLGWGGFWAWDPVETASLIPWLFLTLYYHGKPLHSKSAYLANYIISMPYICALFATYLTRSNIVSSVHSFQTEGTLETLLKLFIPEDNFLMSVILRFIPDEKMLVLFAVILMTFLSVHVLGLKNREIFRLPILPKREDFQASKSRTTALKISFITFFLGTYVLILGLIIPVLYDIIGYIITINSEGFGSTINVTPLYYNVVLALFGGVMLLTQFFCTFFPRLELVKKFSLLVCGIIAGLVFAVSGLFYHNGFLEMVIGEGNPIIVLFSTFWTANDYVNFFIPLLLFGIGGLIAEFIRVALKEEKNIIRKTSQIMLHLSFLVILLGALLSTNMTVSNEIFVQDGGEYQIPGTSLTITVLDLDKRYPQSSLHVVEYDTSFMLSANSRVIGFGNSRLAFDKINRMDHKVTIINDFLSNIYVVTTGVFENSLSENFEGTVLQIKIIPYINILWVGCLFLHFAIFPLTIGRLILLKETLPFREKELEEVKTIVVSSR
ncbi:MAG: cytochrome c biogenesis protein CcsA, partial [Candidatus Heimdallarchaeota archaeon]